MDFEQFLRKEIFILRLSACAVPLAMECFIHQQIKHFFNFYVCGM
jgi:hypothetical protein